MKLVLEGDERLTLEEGDTLTVYELNAGGQADGIAPEGAEGAGYWRQPPAESGVFGSGTLVTCCEILSGYIAPTVNLACALPFYAQAVSVSRINVYLPSAFGPVDIRRRRLAEGEDDWQIIATGYSGAVFPDDGVTAGGQVGENTVYLYQWRLAGTDEGGWSRPDPAWLTRTFDRTISVGTEDVIGLETVEFDQVCEEFAPRMPVDEADPGWVFETAEFAPRLPVDEADPVWNILEEDLDMSFQVGQTPVFLARITNVESGAYLLPAEVEQATYTIEQTSSAFGRNAAGEEVAYHTNQEIPLTAFLEAPIAVPPWSTDEIGYNFKFSPNTRVYPAFAYPGEYIVTFKVIPTVGNPIVWRRSIRFV